MTLDNNPCPATRCFMMAPLVPCRDLPVGAILAFALGSRRPVSVPTLAQPLEHDASKSSLSCWLTSVEAVPSGMRIASRAKVES